MSDEKDLEEANELWRKNIEDQAEHHLRMRFGWDDMIEEMIQEGQERGDFDDLRGKGRPLNLEKSPYGSDWDLAHTLMKDNDVVPAWISDRRQVLTDVETFRCTIAKEWPRYRQAFELAQGKTQRRALALRWEELCREWAGQIVRLNKQISDFNLRRPGNNDRLEIFKLRLDDELTRAGAARQLES